MEPQRRVESQGAIAPNDQRQLVECRDSGGKVRAVAELTAAINNPTNALRGQWLRAIARCDDVADPVGVRMSVSDRERSDSRISHCELVRSNAACTLEQNTA